jgi:hypothetical protein
MRTPKVTLPEEDPATKAAREREERRAENARTEETQAWLLGATGRRNRRFGSLPGGGGGSVPIVGGPMTPGVGSPGGADLIGTVWGRGYVLREQNGRSEFWSDGAKPAVGTTGMQAA